MKKPLKMTKLCTVSRLERQFATLYLFPAPTRAYLEKHPKSTLRFMTFITFLPYALCGYTLCTLPSFPRIVTEQPQRTVLLFWWKIPHSRFTTSVCSKSREWLRYCRKEYWTKMVQNGPNDHFGQNDFILVAQAIRNAIRANRFARIIRNSNPFFSYHVRPIRVNHSNFRFARITPLRKDLIRNQILAFARPKLTKWSNLA